MLKDTPMTILNRLRSAESGSVKAMHYVKVAMHFWPWQRAFWIALFHDSIEDGWMRNISIASNLHPVGYHSYFSLALLALTRSPSETYFGYIERIKSNGGDIQRVKIADLIENYKRATPSLRKRYAKALLILADFTALEAKDTTP